MQQYEQREFTIGNVVGESLSLYRQFFVRFFLVALAVYAIVELPTAEANTVGSDKARALWLIGSIIVDIVGFALIQAALVVAVDDVRDGHIDNSFLGTFERAQDRVPQLVGLSVLLGLSIGVLSGVLVIVGAAAHVTGLGIAVAVILTVFLFTRWSLATPLVVLETLGPWSAMKRSWNLVRGHSFRALLLFIVSGIMVVIAIVIVGGILSAILGHGFVGTWVSSTVSSAVGGPFIALVFALAYFHLRGSDAGAPEPIVGAAYREEPDAH